MSILLHESQSYPGILDGDSGAGNSLFRRLGDRAELIGVVSEGFLRSVTSGSEPAGHQTGVRGSSPIPTPEFERIL